MGENNKLEGAFSLAVHFRDGGTNIKLLRMRIPTCRRAIIIGELVYTISRTDIPYILLNSDLGETAEAHAHSPEISK